MHDHGIDHPDWDPFWRNHESQLEDEPPRCRGECGLRPGAEIVLTGYNWNGAAGHVRWHRLDLRKAEHRLGIRTSSPLWHGDGLLFVWCHQVRRARGGG